MDQNQTSPTQKTILIVDDTPSVLEFVSAVLRNDYNLLRADSGREGIKIANEFPGVIHLLLSDFQMPSITGVDLATELSKSRPELRVLLMSGFDGGMLVLNEGWHFLAKPFIPSQLRSIVATLLMEKPSSRFSISS